MPSPLTMSKDKREEFLAAVHVGVLAVANGEGAPLLTPVWYRYEPGGDVLVNTGADSVKAKLLAAAGRASLCVQREDLPPAFVSVEGPVTISDGDEDERYRIAERYLGAELAKGYLASRDVQSTMVRLTPERWRTQDYAQNL